MMRRILTTLAAVGLVSAVAGTCLAQGDYAARSIVYGKLVNTRIEVDFNGNQFRDVVDFLSMQGNLDILTKWDEDGFGEGFDPEATVSLKLSNPTSLVEILELLMDEVSEDEATWILGDGYVRIGTKEELNQDKYVRIYPIRELLFQAPSFDNAPEMDMQSVLQSSGSGGSGGGGGGGGIFGSGNQGGAGEEGAGDRGDEQQLADELIDIITSIVDPYQWEAQGGSGGDIRYFRGNLLINASDYLHRQVGGYPFPAARVRTMSSASRATTSRYVTLTGQWGMADIVDIRQTAIPILVGGRVISSGGGG